MLPQHGDPYPCPDDRQVTVIIGKQLDDFTWELIVEYDDDEPEPIIVGK